MMVHLRLENPAQALQVVAQLSRASDALSERLLTALTFLGGELQSRMRSRAGGLFEEKSGKLMRSIFFRVAVRKSGNAYVLTAGVARRAFYAAFHEKGIKRKLVGVKAKKGYYQREIYLPPRPFIGPSIDEMSDEIQRTVAEAYAGVFSGS